MACSTPTYKILRCICDNIPEEDRTDYCQGEIIANINNDLHEAYIVLLKMYKNKIIDFEDNNVPIIPYGSLYIKDIYFGYIVISCLFIIYLTGAQNGLTVIK